MATTAAPTVLHLSLVVGGDLRDGSGERLGRIDDLIVRLGDEDYPPVTGVVATVAGRPVFVAAEGTRAAPARGARVRGDADRTGLRRSRRGDDRGRYPSSSC
jgi:hypothetical protein